MADVKFTGNVGKDSELRFTPSGAAVLNFSVADSKSKKLDNGEWETISEQWMNCTIWRELAEFYADKLLKGTRVTVYGEFYSRKYDAKDGTQGVSLDVNVKGVEVHPKRGQQQSQQRSAPADDAWGAPSGGNAQGWGNGAASEPPF
jgi:single-strand DNA-binding protein